MRRFLAGVTFGLFLGLLVMSPHKGAAQQAGANQSERTLTLLHDPKALEALGRSGGLQIMWWRKGDQFVSLGQPRWVIPGKVAPQISGDATGAEYYYFDQVTGRKDGPFRPAQ